MALNFISTCEVFKIDGRIINSADPDQIAPKKQSDLNLHYLLRYFCPEVKSFRYIVSMDKIWLSVPIQTQWDGVIK